MKNISEYDLERIGSTFLWLSVLVFAATCGLLICSGAYAVYKDVQRDDAMMQLCETGRDEACRAIGPPGLVVKEK